MIKLQGSWSVQLHWGPEINQLPFSCDQSGKKKQTVQMEGKKEEAIQEMTTTLTAAATKQISTDVTGMSAVSRLAGIFK